MFFLYKDGHLSNQFLHRHTIFFVIIGWGLPLFMIIGWYSSIILVERRGNQCQLLSSPGAEDPNGEAVRQYGTSDNVFINIPLLTANIINCFIVTFIISFDFIIIIFSSDIVALINKK